MADHVVVSSLMAVDLTSFCRDGYEAGFISLAVKENCDSLDDNVSHSTKVRYLWLHVCQQVRENSRLWERLLTVLTKYGVPRYVLEELKAYLGDVLSDYGGGDVMVGKKRPHGGLKCFREEHIAPLTEILINCSSKYQEIAFCLRLPEDVREESRLIAEKYHKFIFGLERVLKEWIVGQHKHAKPPTVGSLKEALSSCIVRETGEAEKLKENLLMHGVCLEDDEPSTSCKRPRLDTAPLEVVSQTRDCVVKEEKSTLLEVQVCSTSSLSYQWMKDGSPLTDSTSDGYSGTDTEILCINNASLSSEGTYSCEIKCNEDQALVIHSEPLVVTVKMSPLKKVLVDIYNAQPKVPEDSWPPVCTNTYINLALIKSGNIDNANEYTRYTIRNDMDDIYNNKDHAEYEEVFSDLPSGSRLLIEGRPGSGKTTLVHKFSQDWASDKLKLKCVKFLFLVNLRGFFSSPDIQLSDIINKFYKDQTAVENILSFAQKNSGEGLCFVLDGLDEYFPKNKKKTQIFELINKQIYPKAIVVVASRPAATAPIRQVASKRVEVLGFLKEQISEYIDSYKFKSCGTNIKLRTSLVQRKNVEHMCYLPIHAVMVCYLFDMDGFLPETETQMYTQFTIQTLLRTLHCREDSDREYFNSVNDLPEEERKIYSKICKLSFEKTISSKQVMKRKEVEHFFSEHGKDSLGLITVDRMAEKCGFQDLYTFLHLTHQEYLAAYHISKLEEKEQAKVVEEYVGKKHMLVVWKFYCGLVDFTDQVSKFEKMMTKSQDDLFPVQCAFESQQSITCDYLATSRDLTFHSQFLTHSDFVSIGYVMSKATHPVHKLVLDRCNFREEAVSGFLEEVGDKISLIKTFCFHGGNCVREQFIALNSLLKNLKSLEKLNVTGTKINSVKTKYLCKGLSLPSLHTIGLPKDCVASFVSFFKKLSPVLKRIYFGYECNFNLTEEVFGASIAFSSVTALNCISIKKSLSHGDIELLSAGLRENSCCTSLILTRCSIDDRGVKTLADSFSHITSLKELKLNINMIGDEGAKTLSDSLRSCTHICHLDLSFNHITDTGALAIAESLRNHVNLEELDMRFNRICETGATAITKAISNLGGSMISEGDVEEVVASGSLHFKNGTALEQDPFEFSRCDEDTISKMKCSTEFCSKLHVLSFSGDDVKALVDCLKFCVNLNTLNLDHIYIDSVNLEVLACGLKHCNNLQTLNLNDSGIGSDGAKALAGCLKNLHTLDLAMNRIRSDGAKALGDNLKHCNNLQKLNLSYNNTDSDCTKALANVLKHCNDLQVLDLEYNNVDSDGAKDLADGLKHCNNLQTLNLSCNDIGSDGAKALADGLKQCNNLQTLNLSCNDIGSDGAKALADGLKHCNNLQTLNLSYNDVGSDGAKSFADCLERYNNLQLLDLGYNSIDSDGAEALADGLRHYNKLHTLNLCKNSIGSNGVKTLTYGLKHCNNLQALNLGKNSIGSDGAMALADCLKCCDNLEKLNLEDNNIGSDGAKALANGLKHCKNMQTLHLTYRSIGSDGAEALADGLKHCNIQYTLDFSYEAEMEDYVKGLEEAYKSSEKINRKLAHIVFVGPPGSGKSSLMDRLLGRQRKKSSSSTGVCNPIVIVDVDISNPSTFTSANLLDNIWEETKCDASFVKQMREDNTHTQGLEDTPTSPTNNEILAQPLHDVEVDDDQATNSFSQESSSSDEPTKMMQSRNKLVEPNNTIMPPLSPQSVKFTSRPFRESVLSVIDKYGLNEFKEHLEKTCSLYLRDTGGQVEFQEMLALLISGPSIVIFVFRTDLDFSSKFKVCYRKSASESLNSYTSSITTEEALLQSLASVYAMDNSNKDIVKTHEPLVFIVGTHINNLGSEKETKIAALNQCLGSIVEENGFSHLIQYADRYKGQIMFAVDNTSESEDSFQLIRSRVNSLISNRSEFSIQYPISYLLFCLDLQNIKNSVISLEYCRKLAAAHNITGDQVIHLLCFLHLRIGLIRYYDVEGLRHLVIIEPQVLFNKATDLIAMTFSTGSLFSREVTDLEKKGILSAKTFESLKSFSNKISPREFLQLLVHLRITAPVRLAGEDMYFIPCVLNHVSESADENQNTDILPLCVKFKCNHCPKGIFGVLITHLMRPESILSKTPQGVSIHPVPPLLDILPERVNHNITFKLLEDKIFKDQVSFQVQSLGVVDEITLKLFISHLEISFFPDLSDNRDSPVKQVCNSIRLSIENSILSSLKDLHYRKEKVEPMMCFKCEHCSELHPVTKGKVHQQVYCKKFRKTSQIPPHGRCWFDESDDDSGAESTVNSQRCSTDVLPQSSQHGQCVTYEPMKPTLSKLTLIKWKDDKGMTHHFKLIKHISDKWDEMGTLVGLETAQLNGIKQSCLNEANKCCKEVFSHWLEEEDTSEYPKTWGGVCTLLEDVACADVATRLKLALSYATL